MVMCMNNPTLIGFDEIKMKYQECSLCESHFETEATESDLHVALEIKREGWKYACIPSAHVGAGWVCPQCIQDADDENDLVIPESFRVDDDLGNIIELRGDSK